MAVLLVLLWALGFFGGFTSNALIHLLLVIAVVVVLVRVIQGRRIGG